MRDVFGPSVKWLSGFALAINLIVPLENARGEASRPNTPASHTGPITKKQVTIPVAEIVQRTLPRAGALTVAGNWTDSYSYAWTLTQANTTIGGTVDTGGCSVWTVTGKVTSATQFKLTAHHPSGATSGCNDNFTYLMQMTSATVASGTWSSSSGDSGTVTMTYTTPVPVDWQQVGSATAKPHAVLHFDYKWSSTSGNLADLANCKVGENVAYPGAADPYVWPTPPWNGASTPNPTVLWVDATHGIAQDNHSSKGFLEPYASAQFNATQQYRWKCTSLPLTVFSGWDNITINRTISDTTGRGCWTYKITKSGANASEQLPNVHPAKCRTPSLQALAKNVTSAKNDSSEIAMSVSLADASVGLHEPIFADLMILNRLNKEVGIDLGLNSKANLALTVRTPAGGTEYRQLATEGFGGAGNSALPPRGTFKQTLVLNEWYSFPETGTYNVTMTLLNGSAAAGPSSAGQPTATFSLQVGPRNPEQLKRIASKLADQATTGATYADRMAPANALSFIIDPVAVDSLVRVLKKGALVEHYAVAGLERIGSPQAIAALTAAAQSHPDQDVRSAAQSALRMHAKSQGASQPAD